MKSGIHNVGLTSGVFDEYQGGCYRYASGLWWRTELLTQLEATSDAMVLWAEADAREVAADRAAGNYGVARR